MTIYRVYIDYGYDGTSDIGYYRYSVSATAAMHTDAENRSILVEYSHQDGDKEFWVESEGFYSYVIQTIGVE